MTAQEMAIKASGFATVSPAALKLVGMLEQLDRATEEVVEVLKHDTVLTAKLLRACNASSLALAEPVGSIDQAVLILGYHKILEMALALAFGEALAVPMPGYAVEANELWSHSLVAAVAAELVARELPTGVDPAVAFTGGLLHDLGKVVMAQTLTPERQAAIRYQIAEHGRSRAEAERAVLGTDHAEVGACLLRLWRLPEDLIEGVARHHEPEAEREGGLAGVILVANCLAHLAGSAPGWEAYAVKIQGGVAAAFELTREKLERLVLRVRTACAQAELLVANT